MRTTRPPHTDPPHSPPLHNPDITSRGGSLEFEGQACTASSTASSFGSCISLLRKAAEFSRLARGRMISLSMFDSANGTGTTSSLSFLPSLSLSTQRPKLGLARQKAMRTSMLRNS